MCIENESTGKYTCSHAPYTRFTSVFIGNYIAIDFLSMINSLSMYSNRPNGEILGVNLKRIVL